MFVLQENSCVKWPVDIPMPADGGKIDPIRVTIAYKLLGKDQYDALKEDDITLLSAVVVGWDDGDFGAAQTNKGEPISLPFNADNLANLLQFAFVRTGLIRGYWDAQAGLEKN